MGRCVLRRHILGLDKVKEKKFCYSDFKQCCIMCDNFCLICCLPGAVAPSVACPICNEETPRSNFMSGTFYTRTCGHENIATAIRPFLLIQGEHLTFSGERIMHTVLTDGGVDFTLAFVLLRMFISRLLAI